VAFLQGLVSNDVTKAQSNKAVYAALLTPQGKFLHDLFILDHDGAFLIDCESARAEDLIARLKTYKLRAKVTLEDVTSAYDVWGQWGGDCNAALAFADPRLPALGNRAFVAKGTKPDNVTLVSFEEWDADRLALGIADGSRDMEIEKATLGECNFEYINGVSWEKGCYVGQEITARMHYRRLAKKSLFPVFLSRPVPEKTDGILLFRGAEAGKLFSRQGQHAIALINIESANQSITQKMPLNCGDFGVTPFYPNWMMID
jgi:folate-binding protein YgfZ